MSDQQWHIDLRERLDVLKVESMSELHQLRDDLEDALEIVEDEVRFRKQTMRNDDGYWPE